MTYMYRMGEVMFTTSHEEFICKHRHTPSQNWAFMPPCGLYYLVFNVKIFFGKNRQSPVCLPAETLCYFAKTSKHYFRRVAYSNQPRDGHVSFCKSRLEKMCFSQEPNQNFPPILLNFAPVLYVFLYFNSLQMSKFPGNQVPELLTFSRHVANELFTCFIWQKKKKKEKKKKKT